MHKNFLLLIFLFFFFTKNSYGQEIDSKKHINKIHETYEKELGLSKEQSKKIKQIEKFWKVFHLLFIPTFI